MPGDNVIPLRPPRPCPICGKQSAAGYYPFCSVRCADIDLNRWLSGAYVIPAREEESQDESGDEAVRPPAGQGDDFDE